MPPSCRLSVLFASHAPVAVVVRRGPTHWAHLTRWNTLTDEFEPGQWLRGKLYPERCALSPRGELMVYFAYKSGRVDEANGYRREFTAVSRPPHFTALALWPWHGTWGGGGFFKDDRTLVLATNILPDPHPSHLPKRLKVLPDVGARRRAESSAGSILQPERWMSERAMEGVDQQGRRIVVDAGILCAIQPGGEREVLRDFNADLPQPVATPSKAQRWP